MADFRIRQIQVGEKIKRNFRSVLQHSEFDSLISKISVSEVKMSSGLKHADIFIQAISEEETIEIAKELNKNLKTIRFLLAKGLEIRFMPQIKFIADTTIFFAENINRILKSDKIKKDLENS